MRRILLILSFGLILFFLLLSNFVRQKELEILNQLRRQKTIDVEIIEVICKRKSKTIVFNLNGKEYFKSINVNWPKCKKLEKKKYIGLKIGTNGRIIYANDAYNNSLEGVIYAKIILGLFIGILLVYYLVYPSKGSY